MSYIELINITLVTVVTLGFIAFIISDRINISYIPLLIILGLLFGPTFGFIERKEAQHVFDYARVFGLVMILYAEGHNLKWKLIKKHLLTIGLLDTVGLFVTAIIGGYMFSLLFHLPFAAGFLFGAIISATDPATLIPLFKQNKVDENIRTVIVTESIFNDPLGIVLTVLAVALVVPQATEAHLVEEIARYTTLYPAAVIFFLYEIISSVLIGVIMGFIGYWIVKKLKPGLFPQIFGLAMAYGGFLVGEYVQTSGYLVATTIGIVFGNYNQIFKKIEKNPVFEGFVEKELDFNEKLADLATVFIFILIGASMSLSVLGKTFIKGSILALGIVFIARPIAGLMLLPLKRWSFKQYLFISLEGPRGVVPSALAGLPLSLGLMYHDPKLTGWGEIILSATILTVLISVLAETLWVKPLSQRLLRNKKNDETSMIE